MENVTEIIRILITNLEFVSDSVASTLGYIGIAIIIYGALKGFVHFIYSAITRVGHIPHIRIEFAKHLSLGLEFLVGKDIIGTIVNPSWDELGKLGAIIVLRTAVALFLDYELNKMESSIKDGGK
ncbi:DUF1622 domain-containing protein [Patescibacteria group bacterium]|nr:DUF1622 domain-containing protein [Patescibacteria group bacterium]